MLKSTELRIGKYVLIDGATFEILDYKHKKLARGGAIVKTKIRPFGLIFVSDVGMPRIELTYNSDLLPSVRLQARLTVSLANYL